MTLDQNHLGLSFVEVNLHKVSAAVASVQGLDQNARRVSFKNALETVYVDVQADKMALGALFMLVVGNIQFHKLIQASEPIAKRGVFNAFFIRYDVVVERFQPRDRVDHEVSVARDVADWV